MNNNSFELEVPATLENVPVINGFVSDALERLGVDPGDAARIQLVVEEACANVILHAYAGEKGPLGLAMAHDGSQLAITIKDKGKPFDPTLVPPPDLDADLEHRKIGGLGIYLMQKLMDEVKYSFDPVQGNQLVLRKRMPA